jgi:DNA/RNA endonuclease YhcR with UshA esterase domain
MFVQQERTAICILIAVAVAVIGANLVLSAVGKYPFASVYSDRSADGELVRLCGTIGNATVTKNGGHLILFVDNVAVFIPANVAGAVSYTRGQNVTLYGTVQTYRGEKEIIVASAGDIRLVP